MENELVSLQIENKIIVIRGVQVMLDRDLAEFYYKDIENGTLTKDSAYELISKFLII